MHFTDESDPPLIKLISTSLRSLARQSIKFVIWISHFYNCGILFGFALTHLLLSTPFHLMSPIVSESDRCLRFPHNISGLIDHSSKPQVASREAEKEGGPCGSVDGDDSPSDSKSLWPLWPKNIPWQFLASSFIVREIDQSHIMFFRVVIAVYGFCFRQKCIAQHLENLARLP